MQIYALVHNTAIALTETIEATEQTGTAPWCQTQGRRGGAMEISPR